MNRISMLRRESGFSQQELADRLKVHQTAVSQWEKERTAPNFDLVCKMSELFDVSPVYLMGNTSERGHFPTQPDAGVDDSKSVSLPVDRACRAMEQMSAAGQEKVADYAEDILPKYRLQQHPQPHPAPPEGTDTTPTAPPPELPENGR